jgi:hypothetical protein
VIGLAAQQEETVPGRAVNLTPITMQNSSMRMTPRDLTGSSRQGASSASRSISSPTSLTSSLTSPTSVSNGTRNSSFRICQWRL